MNAFNKDAFRSIRDSLGRFLAIAGIVALGAGFYAGLRMTAPDMELAADTYYDSTQLMDLRVLSTLGLNSDDIDALRELEGVSAVMPAYETDVVGSIGSDQYTMRVHSLSPSAAKSDTRDGAHAESNDADYLNRVILVSGRWPTASGECLIASDRVMSKPVREGDRIELLECTGELDETLVTRSYTVVGLARSPYYVTTTNMGQTGIGGGSIEQFMYVPESDFSDDLPYSEAFVKVAGATDLDSSSDEYISSVNRVADTIETIAPERARLRTESIKAEAEDELTERMDEVRGELDSAKARLDSAAAEIAAGENEIEAAERELEIGRAQADELEKISPEQAAILRAQLDEAAAAIEASRVQLAASRAQYEQGLSEYMDGVSQADEAESEAREQIDAIGQAEWYVLDRTKISSCESLRMDTDRIDRIARVFPFIFFLVAALVALTTMTRMVEEQRVTIGTYKALGYSKMRITGKYLLYAALASVSGSIIGIAALSKLLPAVIMTAYAILYNVPRGALPIDAGFALLSAGLGVGVTLLATWAAAASTLREKPASLMLPRAPKAGKRILLEHVGPVWKRLSFSWKVTCRNLFLYKKRLLMTVIGIAGCTALLLTGLGLRDSINDILDLQFGEIMRYDVTLSLDEERDEDEDLALRELLADDTTIREFAWAGQVNALASPGDASDLAVTVVIPESVRDLGNLITWRERRTHESLEPTDDGAVVSEKLAATMGVKPGDKLRLFEQDTAGNITPEFHDVPVSGITENYVSNYVYVTPALFERCWNETVESTIVYARTADSDSSDAAGKARQTLDAAGRELSCMKTVSFIDDIVDTFRTMLKSIDLIVWVLVVAAAALAFIVLYNLTNINITERIREIATLKVLGFTPRELNAYIFREILLLSIAGALLGLVLGVGLESFVVTSAEIDRVMFGRIIHTASFAIAFALTLLFTVIVMLAMSRNLRKVSMVESLKSIE